MRLLISALVLAGLALPAAAEVSQTVPYKEFYDQMARFYGGGNNDRLVLRLSVEPAPKDKTLVLPVTMVVSAPEGDVPLNIGAENAVDIPYKPEWAAANASVTINQAPQTYSLRAQIGMKLSDGDTFPYADVKQAFDQFDKLIDREAGMVAFLAPSAKSVRLHCGTDCTVTLDGAKGQRVLKADDKGRVVIPNDKNLAKENPTLTVSRPVAYTVLTTKG